MALEIIPHLMFQGKAQQAIDLYLSAFTNSKLESIMHYGEEHGESNGLVMVARLNLNGLAIQIVDSPAKHDFTFTASTSLFVTCESEEELTQLHDLLGKDGNTLMPLDNYGFSQKFCWIEDRFGVSWQLNLQ